jgi:glycosyltransferase 2 family protein
MRMKRYTFAVITFFLSAVVLIFGILPILNVSQFMTSLKNTDAGMYALALLVIIISNGFFALRWSVLMQQAGAKKSRDFVNAFGIFSLGQATGLILPTRVGSYSKAPLVMNLDSISYERALAAVNAETIIDMIYICSAGMVSLIIISVLFSVDLFISMLLILTIIVCLIAGFIIFWRIHLFKEMFENSHAVSSDTGQGGIKTIFTTTLGKLLDLIISTREIFSQRSAVVKLAIFTLITQFLGVIGFFLVIDSTHTTLPLITVFAILTLSFLVGIISLIPGGLGASDLSIIVLLEYTGIALPVATNIALLWRFAMYLPILAVSSIYLIKMQMFPEKYDN